ncbi:NADP-dependent dehydrogenase [Tatumella ptyseos ATCC 33301]|uniref:NADP-dependent dehydrogenase n=2 Tax=Tatumella ptyseos TaxID=82987 RepID=A0A085JPY8_9GAMM|nr:NAD(P)-dependent oxidoreductase [Tatumella ptyseos]KFD22534.1 NADP-dependent dehydrogenase [Tatumella ptyseos ATCC 33301]
MSENTGVIGLGNMGAGMASTLHKKGFSVIGYDLSEQARGRLQEKGVSCVDSCETLLKQVSIVILSLPKSEHVEAVCLKDGGIGTYGQPGLIVIDTTTSTPEVSRRVASCLKEKGIGFVDAPVSGGPAGAAAGTMAMVIGAEEEQLTKIMPVLKAMSSTQIHIGSCGAGNVAKIANNLLCATHLIATAEALSMAAKAGVDPQKVLNGINAGSGSSSVSKVSFEKWILNKAYNSGFTMALMRKDVGLANTLAEQLDLHLPLSSFVGQQWHKSIATIPDNEDFNYIVTQTDESLFSRGE